MLDCCEIVRKINVLIASDGGQKIGVLWHCPVKLSLLSTRAGAYGRGAGVGRTRGVARGLGVTVGLGVDDGLAVAVGVAVGDGLAVAVALGVGDGLTVAVGLGVGVGLGPRSFRQTLSPEVPANK